MVQLTASDSYGHGRTTRLIVLDRDGVINHDSDQFIKSPDEWRAIPGSLEAIARLNQAGYRVVVGDHFWHWLYLPVADLVERLSRWIGRLQQGRIAVYLLYSFLTLVGVLVLVKR